MFVYLVGSFFFGILEFSMKYPKLGQLGPSLAKTEDKMRSRGETILHNTPKLEIKQGLDGQTRAQRQGDFAEIFVLCRISFAHRTSIQTMSTI
jgi:hypothetical protein